MRTVKTKNLTILLIAMSVLLLSLGGATYAWLSTAGSSVDPNVSKGSIVRQYFHTGTGTPEDPFVITRPIHYYHMVELYQRIDGFADKDYCFQLGYDLDGDQDGSVGSGESWKVYAYDDFGNVITDASGRPTYSDTLNMKYYSNDLAVLPVGTSDVPFNGTFNGNSLTIDNLYVKSSEFVDMNNNGVVDEGETFGTCDLGIFGFVGEDAVIRNVYYKNVEISL